jgi:hypothetical protein
MLKTKGNIGMDQFSDANTVYKLSSHVALESFDDAALLLRLTDRQLYELYPPAQRMLELTDGQLTVSQVASTLADEFQISEELAIQDVVSSFEELTSQGIVEII